MTYQHLWFLAPARAFLTKTRPCRIVFLGTSVVQGRMRTAVKKSQILTIKFPTIRQGMKKNKAAGLVTFIQSHNGSTHSLHNILNTIMKE